jgi:hypothetical protein
MKQIIIVIFSLLFFQNIFSQTPVVDWGNEFKMDKKGGDLEVIYTDNSGVYIKESHIVIKRLSLIGDTRESATLIKCDKNLKKIYTSDFNSELRSKEFERLMFLNNRLFLFATDYVRRDGMLILYGIEINKDNGKQLGSWKEIANWEKEEKGDDLHYQMSYNYDSSRLLVVSTREGKARNNYEVRQYDADLNPISKPVNITNEFSPKTFDLEDILFARNGNVVVVAKILEAGEDKNKSLRFKGYSVRLYSPAAKLIKDIDPGDKSKIPLRLQVVQQLQGQLAVIAFYCTEVGGNIKGIMTARIDPETGNILGSYSKEINAEIVGEPDSPVNEPDSLKAPPGAEMGISKSMIFRNIVYTPDNGLVVITEKTNTYSYSRTSSTSRSSMGGYSSTTNYYTAYDCEEVMIFKVAGNCEIKWLRGLPKFQHEVIETGSNTTGGYPGGDITTPNSYYAARINRPYYAGFGVCINNEKVLLIVNDYDVNAQITRLGQKPRKVSFMGHTVCYAISYDFNDGNCTRNILFNNRDKGVPTAMPRLGKMLGQDFYMVGKQDRVMGKSKVAIAKLSID